MENQDVIKSAARRMCGYLEAKGLSVKHTQMLEALAIGFGLDSWRELKAVIDAPRAQPKPVVPPLGEWQTWSVHALYLDNDQQYGDDYPGRTPLEAAMNAIMERLTDCGLEIRITEVLDQARECRLSPSFLTDIEPLPNRRALEALANAARPVVRTDEERLALQWLDAVLDEYPKTDMLSELTDCDALEKARSDAVDPAVDGRDEPPTKLLDMLCELVERDGGGVVQLEKADEALARVCYQVRALCGYFGAVLDDGEVSLLAGCVLE